MARKPVDINELARSLKAPAFENRDSEQTALGVDPVSPTVLVLSLAEIKSYEHNPRRAENPEFYRLKDSIASRRGLTTPLTVTKRPGDARFTIAAGGNSRLQVLNELFDETQDEIFNRVTCQFVPWDSDCQVLANHLIENDVRGNMTFADKARAIVEWQHLYEAADPESSSLSQRELQSKLSESGFQVSQALLSRYLYTVEHLLPVLPKTLESGLGRTLIEQLIRFRTFAQQHWDEVPLAEGFSPQVTFRTVFAAACEDEDGHCDDWNFDIFRAAFAIRVADALNLDPKMVAIDLESLYRGIPVGQLGSPAQSGHAGKPQWVFERAREHLAGQIERARERRARDANKGGADEVAGEGGGLADPVDVAGQSSVCARDGCEPQLTIRTTADLESPRVAIYELARRVAASSGLDDLLKACDVGVGFYIDAPEPPATGIESRDGSKAEAANDQGLAYSPMQSWIWWCLCLCAGQLDAAHVRAIGAHDPGSWFVQLFQQLPQRAPDKEPVDALYLLVGQPDWSNLVPDFLGSAALPDDAFAKLMALVCDCRAFSLACDSAGISPWGASK